MKEVLEILERDLNLHNEDSAFEVLSGILLFRKSSLIIFNNNWIKIETRANKYCNDNSDGKIDLICHEKDDINRVITMKFVQCKNSDSFSENDVILFCKSVKDYFFDMKPIILANYLGLKDKQNEIATIVNNNLGYSLNYEVFFVSSRGIAVDNESILIAMQNEFSGLANVSCELIGATEIETLLDQIEEQTKIPRTVCVPLILENNATLHAGGDFKGYSVVLNEGNINSIIEEEGKINVELSRLFNDNVRGFLEKTDVNEEIKSTIEKYPESFYFFNNGATIFCDEIQIDNLRRLKLINPRIINGQQTIALIHLYGRNTGSLYLNCKLIETLNKSDDKMKMNYICHSSNTSNVIKPINLISNSRNIISICDYFDSKGIVLKIKEGQFLNYLFAPSKNVLDLEELLKLWAGTYLERPDLSKRVGAIVSFFYLSEIGKKYKFLNMKKSIKKLNTDFFEIYEFSKEVDQAIQPLASKDYFAHGRYFIMYYIYITYGKKVKSSIIDISKLDKDIMRFVSKYNAWCKKNGKSPSLNNYFKSTLPIQHASKAIVKINDQIEKHYK